MNNENKRFLRAMLFVDGAWVYHNRQLIIQNAASGDFEIDYRKIPQLAAQLIEAHSTLPVDVVRTCYFAAIPVNKPGFNPAKQETFYQFLSNDCHFDVEIFEMDFRNNADLRPREKCVDIALTASMMYYAAIPDCYDVAILVAGDSDYIALLQRVRALGKRTMLLGIKGNGSSSAPTSKYLYTEPGLFDYEPIFLDERAEDLRLIREAIHRACDKCGTEEETTWAGESFYCSNCRVQNARQLRSCDDCGKEEDTTWDKPWFYCSECRETYRRAKSARV